jgi:hypothetical protein
MSGTGANNENFNFKGQMQSNENLDRNRISNQLIEHPLPSSKSQRNPKELNSVRFKQPSENSVSGGQNYYYYNNQG